MRGTGAERPVRAMKSRKLDGAKGYRPRKSAIDALTATRQRCWRYDWVIDLDVRGFFDNLDHSLVMRAVRKYTRCRWILLYVQRWLTAPMQQDDGTLVPRTTGTPQGGVASPLLANIFLHLAFDDWMRTTHPDVPFERYADDIVAHCRTETQAQQVLSHIKRRLAQCRLEVHPEKTRIVYCKDRVIQRIPTVNRARGRSRRATRSRFVFPSGPMGHAEIQKATATSSSSQLLARRPCSSRAPAVRPLASARADAGGWMMGAV